MTTTSHSFDKQFIFSGKVKSWSLIFIAIGIIGIICGFASGAGERTFANLLVMSYYFAGVCVFAAGFYAILLLAQAGWSVSISRIPHALIRILPIAATILIVIIGAGIFLTHESLNHEGHKAILPYLYKVWSAHGVTDPKSPHFDALVTEKSGFLNIPFFFVRLLAYLGAYTFMGRLFVKYSVNEDSVGGLTNHKKSFKLACIFLVIWGFTIPLFVFDVIMSLEPHWFSTLFGWYNFSSLFVSVIVVITLIAIHLHETGNMNWINVSQFHTLGILIFGFSIFWAYLWFEQYLLIYYANMPEETVYFYNRLIPQFNTWFWVNMVLNFIAPFCVLMTSNSKRKIKTLKITCIILVIGHWLDFWVMVIPGTSGADTAHWYSEIGWLDLSVFLGFTGLFTYLAFSALAKFKSMAPKNHPLLEESLHYRYG